MAGRPHRFMKRARLQHGSPETGTAGLEPGSVDLVVADPPYNIGVQGSQWDCIKDYMGFSRAWLTPVVRALRKGGTLLLYGSPCRDWVARVTILLVDELGMQYVQDLPWVYTQGQSPPSRRPLPSSLAALSLSLFRVTFVA